MDEKTIYQAEIFTNRCVKRLRQLKKWARKNSVTCYRIYDRDIPEIPLAVDLYEFLPKEISSSEEAKRFVEEEAALESQNIPQAKESRLSRTHLKIFLYERPVQHKKSDAEEEAWLLAMCEALAKAVGIDKSRIVTKIRRHEKGGAQYAKHTNKKEVSGCVFENNSIFFVNLSDYLDTGLFLDMRRMRKTIMEASAGKSVLNLFCYTSSFSVAAMRGGAKFVHSVDLSNTYIEWSKKNFALNAFDKNFSFTKGDALDFLKRAATQSAVASKNERASQTARRREHIETAPQDFDIIILDPPTFSNSKMTKQNLDLRRDWSVLVNLCLKILKRGGSLYFSTNAKSLSFDKGLIHCEGFEISAREITDDTIDADFSERKSHRAYLIEKKQQSKN